MSQVVLGENFKAKINKEVFKKLQKMLSEARGIVIAAMDEEGYASFFLHEVTLEDVFVVSKCLKNRASEILLERILKKELRLR